MNQRHIMIDCPDELLLALGEAVEEFEKDAKFFLAAKLYELGRLSSGKSAQLAGMNRVDFLLGLHRIGIPVLDLGEEEMKEESQ